MNILTPYFFMALSFFPTQTFQQDNYRVQFENTIQTEIVVGTGLFDVVFIEGGIKTDMNGHTDNWTFWPYYNEYLVRGFVKVGPFNVGAEHICGHTVVPWGGIPYGMRDMAHDRFFVDFDTRRIKKERS